MKILFITDIHQNISALQKIDFGKYDLLLCGGDFIDPANINFDIVKNIIDILPAETIIIPGNVDNHPMLDSLLTKFQNIHMKKISLNKENMNIDLMGLGYARSLIDDFIEYRHFFEADESRIVDFYKNSPAKFIIQSCGIFYNDGRIEYADIDSCIEKSKDFVNKFGMFDENDAANFFNTIDKLNNGIFLTHSPLRGVLDKLPYLPEIGAVAAREAVDRLQPRLVLCGHFHENAGTVKLGDTTVFNPGALKDGWFGEIDFTADNIVVNRVKV